MRKPRNANRGTTQAIEDQFADLSCDQQERVLETLTSLHRWCKRERSRKADSPTDEEVAYVRYVTALWNPADPPPSAGDKRESGSTGDDAHAAGRAAYFDAIGQPDPAKNAALDLPEDHEK